MSRRSAMSLSVWFVESFKVACSLSNAFNSALFFARSFAISSCSLSCVVLSPSKDAISKISFKASLATSLSTFFDLTTSA